MYHLNLFILIKNGRLKRMEQDENPIKRHRRIDSAHFYGKTILSGSNPKVSNDNGDGVNGNGQ